MHQLHIIISPTEEIPHLLLCCASTACAEERMCYLLHTIPSAEEWYTTQHHVLWIARALVLWVYLLSTSYGMHTTCIACALHHAIVLVVYPSIYLHIYRGCSGVYSIPHSTTSALGIAYHHTELQLHLQHVLRIA